jgi:hypothetical protein
MLNWKIVAPSLASFAAISFVLCVGYGLRVPTTFHAAWLLEALLPGFTWVSVGSVVLGLIETTLYGAGAGILFSTLYNFFARRAVRREAGGLKTVRVACVVLGLLTAVVAALTTPPAWAQSGPTSDVRSRLVVTVQELIDRDHRLAVAVGTEVSWSDPHFLRVWFPTGEATPRVERTPEGFRTVFTRPGTYRSAFTIAGGRRSNDVYPLVVTVTER